MPDQPNVSTVAGQQSQALLRTLMGKALRKVRLQQTRTLADVARSARISLPYLSEIERGRKEASSEILAAICEALGIELADLLGGIVLDLTGRHVAPVVRLDVSGERHAVRPRVDHRHQVQALADHRPQLQARASSSEVFCLAAAA